jgi:glycosyltransferase involved in cell wall biosynthesis
MRILLSAFACDPDAGSEPGNGWNWAIHLAEAGHDVWVLTGGAGKDRRLERAGVIPNLHFIDVPPASVGTRVLRGAPRGHLRYVTWLRRSYRVARRLVATMGFDVAHHVTFGSLVWGCPLSRLDVPFVFGPVGGGQVVPPALGRYLARHRWIELLRSATLRPLMRVNPMARATLRRAAVVFVTNADTERLVSRCGARRTVLVCDTAVPPAMIRRGPPEPGSGDGISVLWLGRLLPRKGLPLALDALSRTSSDLPWRGVIVGGGPLADEVPGWLKRADVDGRVRWTGQIPWEDVSRLYEASDIFLFTSLRDASGAQLFEAAAFGLPMVGLRHQGMADLIPDDVAIKVPIVDAAGTADGLARAIETLARDEALRERMGQAAVRFARDNTWPRRVDQVYGIIERVLQGPDGRPAGGGPSVS